MTNDQPFQPMPARLEPPEDDAHRASLERDLRRALAAAGPEDRVFVLRQLEVLARRFRTRRPS